MPIMDCDSEIIHESTGFSAFTQEWTGIELLHEGRYFLVYRAMRMGRWFVLKCVRKDISNDVMHRTLLEKEFGIGFHLQHPNIVRTLGMEEVDGLGTCLVLDFIDGMTLRECIEQKNLDVAKCRSITEEMFSVLAYLHEGQITHRDIKPENIMVTSQGGHTFLIDFGLADTSNYAMLKGAAGTRRYAAPECEEGVCDHLSDIYSLGMVIGEMNRSLKTADRRLARLAKKCTCKNRDARLQSAENALAVLQVRHDHRFVNAILAICVIVFSTVAFYHLRNSGTKEIPFKEKSQTKDNAPAVDMTPTKDTFVVKNTAIEKQPKSEQYPQKAERKKDITQETVNDKIDVIDLADIEDFMINLVTEMSKDEQYQKDMRKEMSEAKIGRMDTEAYHRLLLRMERKVLGKLKESISETDPRFDKATQYLFGRYYRMGTTRFTLEEDRKLWKDTSGN